MNTIIKVIQKISIQQNIDNVSGFLKNIKNIERYKPKIISVNLFEETTTTGQYHATGKFLGIPWQGKFNYKLMEFGFHSMMEGLFAYKMQGGFVVKSIASNECSIMHYEEYVLPAWGHADTRWNFFARCLQTFKYLLASKIDINIIFKNYSDYG